MSSWETEQRKKNKDFVFTARERDRSKNGSFDWTKCLSFSKSIALSYFHMSGLIHLCLAVGEPSSSNISF